MTQIELSGYFKYYKCLQRKMDRQSVNKIAVNRIQADETNRILELKYLFGTKTKFEKEKEREHMALPKKECVQLTNQDSA